MQVREKWTLYDQSRDHIIDYTKEISPKVTRYDVIFDNV